MDGSLVTPLGLIRTCGLCNVVAVIMFLHALTVDRIWRIGAVES